MREEQEIINESYRTALYDMFTAMISFLSVEDMEWLMPRLIQYAKDQKRSMQR